jgi:DNA polymerase-1
MTKIVAMDIETESLDPQYIWVICAEDVDTGERETFCNLTTIPEERDRFVRYVNDIDYFVFHNGLGFDVPVINKLLGQVIDPQKVIDTLVVSRLVDYTLDGAGHSLKAWGKRLGDFKIGFNDFTKLSDEMIEYCEQDVAVTVKIYRHFKKVIQDPEWQESLRCEHDIQMLCEDMTTNGFYFDEDQAEELLGEIQTRMEDLEQGLQEDFPPKLTEVNRIKYRRKADGSLYSSVTKAQEKYFATALDKSVDPNELVCYEYIPFNPASPKQRIERLWEAGWEPFEKTKGHIEYDREQQRKY